MGKIFGNIMQQLTNIDQFVLNDSYILVHFNNLFEQENIDVFQVNLLESFSDSSVIERYEGADRVSFRLKINSLYCVLHFEVYSQSCWLEAEAEGDNEKLAVLHQILTAKLT